MRVRMRVPISGSRDNQPWPLVGHTLVVGEEEALELSRSGIATIVPDDDTTAHAAPDVGEESGRAVADLDEHEDAQPELVDERPVELATDADGGQTAATDTGSAQRKAARGGRRAARPEQPEPDADAVPAVATTVGPDAGPKGIQPGQR